MVQLEEEEKKKRKCGGGTKKNKGILISHRDRATDKQNAAMTHDMPLLLLARSSDLIEPPVV